MSHYLCKSIDLCTIQIIPVGGQHDFQTLQCVDKTLDGQIKEQPLMFVRYVPLVESK